MERSSEMKEHVNSIAKAFFGRTLDEANSKKVCIMCGQPVGEFRNELSKKEYSISGFCQDCQDNFFGKD